MKIGTHDGNFHCDEALAIYMLRLLPAYKDATVIRTRNPQLLNECDLLVDVGAVYDPSKHRYDHHQREFKETLSPQHPTKLSSAGLIYKHFGKEIIQQLSNHTLSPSDTDLIFEKIYLNFIEALDAIDNGKFVVTYVCFSNLSLVWRFCECMCCHRNQPVSHGDHCQVRH